MPRMNERDTYDLLRRLYQATAEETLWPRIVARLKRAYCRAGETREPMEAAGHPELQAAVEQPGALYLADSVAQFSYEVRTTASPQDHAHGSTEQASHVPRLQQPCAGAIPAGNGTLPPEVIASLARPGLSDRPEPKLPDAASPTTSRAGELADVEKTVLQHAFLALQIARKFEDLRTREKTLAACVSRLAVGMILIDGEKRATPMNEEARAILDKRDLDLRDDRLTIADQRAQIQLDHLLDGLTDMQAGRPTGGGLTVRRRNGHALQIWGVLLQDAGTADTAARDQPRGILFVVDPDRTPSAPEHLLIEAFGLTRAETTLTLALLCGETVDAYCDRTGISRNTARTHMRAIFDKLGINKQTELLRLLSGFRLLNMGGGE